MLAESAPWTAPQSLPFTTLNYREKSPTFLVLAQKKTVAVLVFCGTVPGSGLPLLYYV